MEYKQRFIRAIYMAMEGMPKLLMHLPEGKPIIATDDFSDEEYLSVIHLMKGSIDRKEYDIVKKILRIEYFFGLTDCLGEISVASYAVKIIEDFETLKGILDCIPISSFEGVLMEDSPVEIALWQDNERLIEYFNQRGFKNEGEIVEGWPKNFDDIGKSCVHKRITLDEYKYTCEYAKQLFLEIISEKLQSDEVIYLEYHNNRGDCKYHANFDSFDSAQCFIMRENGMFANGKINEDMQKNGWWKVVRRKCIGGFYEDSMTCQLDATGYEVITFDVTEHFNPHYMFRHHELASYVDLVNDSRENIDFNFEVGTICYLNLQPIKCDKYVIFLGYHKVSEYVEEEPYFLIRNDNGMVIADTLAHSAEEFSPNSVYHLLIPIEVEDCPDNEFKEYSTKIKEDSTLARQFVEKEDSIKIAKQEVKNEKGKLMIKRETISLEEYRERIARLRKMIKEELLTDAKLDEFYYVTMCYCEGDDGPRYADAFKKRDNMFKFIAQSEGYADMFWEEEHAGDEESDEYPPTIYWIITKYKVDKTGEYSELFSIKWSSCYGIIGLSLGIAIYDDSFVFSNTEKELLTNLENMMGTVLTKIRFPYNKGDIIEVNNTHFSEHPSYFVFLGVSDKVLMYDYENELSIERAFSISRNDVECKFLPCYYKKIDSCSDLRIQNISNHIKYASADEINAIIKTFDYDGMEIETLNERDRRLKDLEERLTH